MKPIDEINNNFTKTNKNQFDPVVFLDDSISIMDKAFEKGNEYDPRECDKAQEACNAYGAISKFLQTRGFQSAAEAILADAWDKFGEIQYKDNLRIYRAGIGMYLAQHYLYLGDRGSATRWALYTHADDILGKHPKKGGNGKQMLLTILGMSDEELNNFTEIAEENLKSINQNWNLPNSFAEDVVTRFLLKYPESSHLFANSSSKEEYKISKPYYSSLLEQIDIDHSNVKEKGNALEYLASYLFTLVPGWCPRQNIIDEYETFENDIVIRNVSKGNDPASDILGRHYLIECKNWENKIGVSLVGYFLYRMRLTHVKFGVIFSKFGITGTEENEKNARSIIRKAFHEDGSICIVIQKNDLENLLDKTPSFISLLYERIERIRFGKTITDQSN